MSAAVPPGSKSFCFSSQFVTSEPDPAVADKAFFCLDREGGLELAARALRVVEMIGVDEPDPRVQLALLCGLFAERVAVLEQKPPK